MGKKLRVELLENWQDCSNDMPDGLPTYSRATEDATGALQVSYAEYREGEVPDPSEVDLVLLSCLKAEQGELGEPLRKDSNGHDIIMVTFSSDELPNSVELAEADTIARSIRLG